MGTPDTYENVVRFLGADQPAPSRFLRWVRFPDSWRGTLPPDLWTYLAQWSVIPLPLDRGMRLQDVLDNGYPVLYLSDNGNHWSWITGHSKSRWWIECPTLGGHWEQELDGLPWYLAEFTGSFTRAFVIGVSAIPHISTRLMLNTKDH
jgi:hypothetical protein